MAKLYFRYAAMNAGKSTQLLQINHNYQSQGREVLLMTSGIDDRYGVGKITSRLGVSADAEIYNDTTDLFERVRKFKYSANAALGAILIDEAQFLTSQQVSDLHRAVHVLGVPILCFGIRSDFRGMPFPGSAMLMTLAEDIEEIKNVCGCGAKATMNMRVDKNGDRVKEGPQIEIGDARYMQVCGRCFYQAD